MTDVRTFVKWFNGLEGPSSERLRIQKSFIDVLETSGRFLGTVAIKFNHVVLLNTSPRFTATRDLEAAADICGFQIKQVSNNQMTSIRAAFSARDGLRQDMILPLINALGPLASLFPPRHPTDNMISYARAINALEHRGEMTHVLVREQTNAPTLQKFYPSADEAMLDFMKMSDTRRFRIVEF